ncbi:hypothetical protein ACFDTO_04685 [Microbacteriaceae bacterium 4G12]
MTVAAALILAVAGCTPPAPEPTLTPSPAPTPVFASDEEALAAAEKAYTVYLAMSDLIAQEGGANPERMQEVATGEALDSAVRDLRELSEGGFRVTGTTTFTFAQPEEIRRSQPPLVAVYVCDDVSEVDVLNTAGESIVSPDRPAKSPFAVRFESGSGEALLVTQREFWEGRDFC